MEQLTVQGTAVPALGFGTWQLHGDEAYEATRHALELGYRHLDTARMYANEAEVGRAIADSGVDRDEIYLVTKVRPGDADRRGVAREAAASLRELGTDHVDLLLLHAPSEVEIGETLDAFVDLREREMVRAFGVSNFSPAQLEEAVSLAPVFADQVRYQPGDDRSELLDLAERHDLTITAYSPLRGGVLDDPTLAEIGEAHGKSAAQVALRWLLQQPRVTVIPRSSNPDHRAANLDVFDFELTDAELTRIAG